MTDVLRITCFKWYDANYRWNKIYAHDALHVNRLRNMVDRHTTIPHEFCCITDDAEGIDQGLAGNNPSGIRLMHPLEFEEFGFAPEIIGVHQSELFFEHTIRLHHCDTAWL